jgi:hypothetical protein
MRMDPSQELFTAMRQRLIELFGEGNVYDTFLPPEGTPYPFAYIAESWLDDEPNKGAVFGRVHQVVHFWHNNPKKRGTLTNMMLQTKQKAHALSKTDNFMWMHLSTRQRILTDNTTAQPLLHGVLELEFKFS